jgi:hypothetical protein
MYSRDNYQEPKLDKVSNLWEKSQENKLIQDLKAGKNLQETIDSLENIQEAFTTLDVIVCSDGRVLSLTCAKLGLAGEGILLEKEDLDRFIEKYQGKIKKVTSHEDCGAASIAFGKKENATGTADELGMSFAEWLAGQLGAEYEHIPMEKMRSTIHDERAICFDGTGKFNPAALSEMPAHFVCSGYSFGLGKEYMKAELETLAGIALGHHGFGHRFDADNKFYIIVSAKDASQLAEMESIAKEAVSAFGDKVEVRGFVHKIEE